MGIKTMASSIAKDKRRRGKKFRLNIGITHETWSNGVSNMG